MIETIMNILNLQQNKKYLKQIEENDAIKDFYNHNTIEELFANNKGSLEIIDNIMIYKVKNFINKSGIKLTLMCITDDNENVLHLLLGHNNITQYGYLKTNLVYNKDKNLLCIGYADKNTQCGIILVDTVKKTVIKTL